MSTEDRQLSKEELFRAKAARRRDLAKLPIEEKIKILVKLQTIASSIGSEQGREVKAPWNLK